MGFGRGWAPTRGPAPAVANTGQNQEEHMTLLDQAEQDIAAAHQLTASGDPLRRNPILDRLHSARDALREAEPTNGHDADRKARLAAEIREINNSLGPPGSQV